MDRKKIIAKFMSRCTVTSDGSCWEWKWKWRKRNSTPNKYGSFMGHRAHRISWMIFKGTPIGALYVCHNCDNPNCVNPDHLFLGTHEDNMKDKVAKGRHRHADNIPEVPTRPAWRDYVRARRTKIGRTTQDCPPPQPEVATQ